MPTTTLDEARVINQTFFDYLGTPGMEKYAVDAANDFTRVKMREDGAYRKIIPAEQITSNEELDRLPHTDKPYKIVEKEPGQPPAVTLPFASLPIGFYIRGPRYVVSFGRIESPKFVKEVDELRTWRMDVREVLTGNAIKDMLELEDSTFINAVNAAMLGQNVLVPYSGTVQWRTISGGIDRDSINDALKILSQTNGRLFPSLCLINTVTAREIIKMGRDEVGGDFSQEMFKNGWVESDLFGLKWMVTIKRNIVPDDTMFMFADPKFIGKSYILEDATMYIERKAYMIEFWAYETLGGAIGNIAGVARADFV